MKYTITEIEPYGSNLKVVISHEKCGREVFGFPIELAKDNKFLVELNRIMKDREEKEQKHATIADYSKLVGSTQTT